ncbi:hypothetical protein UVI_02054690 [Ustilaginoidea virens]|uniref:tRNA-intron lyase n=1 Tax=Ustilaginoidea virens TaxID=1159556 RepID=A0A1B5L7M1_USTVR|nr:hypothetical protein UVI_02054690 [Ustilaginoidea virens]
MAETQTKSNQNGHVRVPPAESGVKRASPRKKGPSIHQIYALPAPIRTFPLPAFYPNNPLSFFTVAYAWLRQTVSPPPSEPSLIHQGTWSEGTSSVHVTDEKSVRALWEQGFYGKGSLSRSEPNWLKREQVRRGHIETHVSEVLTVQRREERAKAKWERARLEQEAIRQTRLREAQEAESTKQTDLATWMPPLSPPVSGSAPVGPLELLSLPNSHADMVSKSCLRDARDSVDAAPQAVLPSLPVNLKWPNALELTADKPAPAAPEAVEECQAGGTTANGASPQSSETSSACDVTEEECLKRRKSVRFSPEVESTTFSLGDPPNSNHSANGKNKPPFSHAVVTRSAAADVAESSLAGHEADARTREIVNKEHLQLTPEEAFFLTFGFGALMVNDPKTGKPFTTRELLTMFRQHSFFPPRTGPDDPDLEPDDNFLVHYAVYHHFRSLGWVPRAGIKFGVDWLLYTRGPVFDHAEFGLIVLPSYSDSWWKASGKRAPDRTWHWLHGVVRVLSHAIKSLVLVYVEIPPPPKYDAALETGFAEALQLYKIREVTVKRWSSNRNR